MTLPASGPISLSQVNTELSRSATASINLNEAAVRQLLGVSTGPISLSDGYGKSAVTLGFIPNTEILGNRFSTISLLLLSNGSIDSNDITDGALQYLTPITAGAGAAFEARFFLNSLSSGTFTVAGAGLTVGNFSAWYGLEVNRTAVVTRTTGSRADADGVLYIRNKTTLNEVSIDFFLIGDN